MTIRRIQGLMLSDFEVFKNTLLSNQRLIHQKLKEENIFISALSIEELSEKTEEVRGKSVQKYPLLGVPFAVKDNIDVEGFKTTAGCSAFGYMPKASAFAVKQLEAAGAICIGKTNLDQFATGLVGTRSPYGVPKNYYNEDYIPGGSSSGSASAITAGYVPFSIGTDTAGSGRVPAAFQNLIGFKPSKGIVSFSGVVPACKSLDCVTVFAKELQDTQMVLKEMIAFDIRDVYARKNKQFPPNDLKKIGVPRKKNLNFFGNTDYQKAYFDFIGTLKSNGFKVREIDFSPMLKAAQLLYNGPWVAERYSAVGDFIEKNPDAVLDVSRAIILNGKNHSAVSCFEAAYQLNAFRKKFNVYAAEFDAFIMPTTGTTYKLEEVERNPVNLNSNLGYYTNFINLLKCTAIALPVAILKDNLPFGVTAFAPDFNDDNLLELADILRKNQQLNLPDATKGFIDLAVCGAHKRSGALNHQLTAIGAVYKTTALTGPEYRFFALENLNPPRPGLVRDKALGNKIEVEVWKVPSDQLGGFINRIGEPLSFGKIVLENGESVTSFLCESHAVKNAKEITQLGSWEKYLSS